MKKIEKMTSEQQAQIPKIIDHWVSVAHRTDTPDDETIRNVVTEVYKAADLKEPVVFVMDCPLTCLLARAILRANLRDNLGDNLWANLRANLGDNLWDNLGDNLGDNLWANLWANLRANLGANLRDNLGDNLGDNLWANLRDNLGDNLWANLGANLRDNLGDNLWANLRANLGANLWDNLWANLRANLGANLRDNLGDNLWANLGANLRDYPSFSGAHDAGWLSFYAFGGQISNSYSQKELTRLNSLIALAETAGWLYAYPEIAFISRRNTIVRQNDSNRLHCEDGPAMAFRSGYAIYAWHGTRIPGEWINDPQSLTPETALRWENVEQRRAACEIIGWNTILTQLNAKTIDVDDPEIGTLVEVELPDSGPEKFLKVQCGTQRQFALPVPPDMQTALEANAWTYGYDVKEFKIPEIRT